MYKSRFIPIEMFARKGDIIEINISAIRKNYFYDLDDWDPHFRVYDRSRDVRAFFFYNTIKYNKKMDMVKYWLFDADNYEVPHAKIYNDLNLRAPYNVKSLF